MGIKAFVPGTDERRERLWRLGMQKRVQGYDGFAYVEYPDGAKSFVPVNYDREQDLLRADDGRNWKVKGQGSDGGTMMGIQVWDVTGGAYGVVSTEACVISEREDAGEVLEGKDALRYLFKQYVRAKYSAGELEEITEEVDGSISMRDVVDDTSLVEPQSDGGEEPTSEPSPADDDDDPLRDVLDDDLREEMDAELDDDNARTDGGVAAARGGMQPATNQRLEHAREVAGEEFAILDDIVQEAADDLGAVYDLDEDDVEGFTVSRRTPARYAPWPVTEQDARQAVETARQAGSLGASTLKILLIGIGIGAGLLMAFVVLQWLLGEIAGGGGGGAAGTTMMLAPMATEAARERLRGAVNRVREVVA